MLSCHAILVKVLRHGSFIGLLGDSQNSLVLQPIMDLFLISNHAILINGFNSLACNSDSPPYSFILLHKCTLVDNNMYFMIQKAIDYIIILLLYPRLCFAVQFHQCLFHLSYVILLVCFLLLTLVDPCSTDQACLHTCRQHSVSIQCLVSKVISTTISYQHHMDTTQRDMNLLL